MTLKLETDPEEVGLDERRLARIGRHFDRYIDDGLLPGWMVVVARHGRVAYLETSGYRDVEQKLPVEADTLWRIYSMTKPITAVAALSLWEEGAFELRDPVSRWIPSLASPRVYTGGSSEAPVTVPAIEPIRVWHLFTHTSGLTYGFHRANAVDALYRKAGYEWGSPKGTDLARATDDWASLPLLFQPGTEWNYGFSTDVLGRLLEVIEGKPIDEILADRVLKPLGMTDTHFWAQDGSAHRLGPLYVPEPGTKRALAHPLGKAAFRKPTLLAPGAGLVSTAGDYHRFATMLLRGGVLEGVRILSPRTVERMASNHLPGGVDLVNFGRPLFAETPFEGAGFGLGVSVTLDPVATLTGASVGDFGWGGAASTAFWVDPVEDMTAVFMTQLLPSSTHPIRSQLRQLVQQALVD